MTYLIMELISYTGLLGTESYNIGGGEGEGVWLY